MPLVVEKRCNASRADVSSSRTTSPSSTIAFTQHTKRQSLREKQLKVREEMARLTRLQELADLDARLEQELNGDEEPSSSSIEPYHTF
jgi:hypothetical protein